MGSTRRSLAAGGTGAVRRAVASAATLPSTPAALAHGETAVIASSSSTVWPPQCSVQKSRCAVGE
jgi:hypothetical protein